MRPLLALFPLLTLACAKSPVQAEEVSALPMAISSAMTESTSTKESTAASISGSEMIATPPRNAEHAIVVELFTSEGCSSCPPADEVLNRLPDTINGARVIPLAFHVDYWDDLGWADLLARRAFTARQRSYATALGSNRVYTPQAVLNGREEFTGSHESRIRNAQESVPVVPLQITRDKKGIHTCITVAPSLLSDETTVSFGITEAKCTVHVSRGENAGKVLEHRNSVLDWQVAPIANGHACASLPLLQGKEGAVVALVSHGATGSILAANRMPVP